MSGDNEGFGLFRRMARKVTAPAREFVSGGRPGDPETGPTEFDKAEMKAMIERKRRNDYVRKRELDMLRHIRREGLSGEQAAALTLQSSRLDEVESRSTQSSIQGPGIKAKIDAIERQMVGASAGVSAGHAPKPPVTRPGALAPGAPPPVLTTTLFGQDDSHPTLPPGGGMSPAGAPRIQPVAPLDFDLPESTRAEPPAPAPAQPISLPALDFEAIDMPSAPFAPTALAPYVPSVHEPAAAARAPAAQTSFDLGHGERVEVSEARHDEGLDEPVIAYASGDFQGCERSLQALVAPRGARHDHEETWLVLFDLYRAIGQQAKFEALTMDYAEHFHRSGPQWFSLPRLLADATALPAALAAPDNGVGWVCPPRLDGDAVNRLEALSMQMPLPWVMDWEALDTLDVEGAGRLQKLFTGWSSQAIKMRWVGGEKLLAVLQEAAPTGVRDVDPVYWMLRLEALRLAHRPDQFDEVAIDFCVTFEVSPPSWENSRSKAHFSEGHANTRTLSLSVVGEPVTTFMDTHLAEEDSAPAPVQMTSIELSGQLSGDIANLLAQLAHRAGDSQVIRISCALLMRVDFVAAGDLLNWVATRHAEGREVVFQETHRLVALMFGAMGINENARVQLRHG
jgi:hypothetical protein